MAEGLKCGCCGLPKDASACVASRLAKRRVLCKACMSKRNRSYFASNRHVFLAGVSRRALGMRLPARTYSAVLAKYGNRCVMSGASGELVPLVLVRVKQGGEELAPVIRHLATKHGWVLPAHVSAVHAPFNEESSERPHDVSADVGPGHPPPLNKPSSCSTAAHKKGGDALVSKGAGIPRRMKSPGPP